MKPLFIPLRSEWFDAFARGEKTTEYRRAGGPWNERTCTIGRSVVLSRGYGKQARLTGRVVSYAEIPTEAVPAALTIYPDASTLAAIGIVLDAPEVSAAA